MALSTRARVELFTTLALLSTRDTVAVETLARRATCSRFICPSLYPREKRRLVETFLTSNVAVRRLPGPFRANVEQRRVAGGPCRRKRPYLCPEVSGTP